MSLDVASRGHGHRHPGQQHGGKPGQAQVTLGTLQGVAEPRSVAAHVVHLDAVTPQALEQRRQLVQRLGRAGGEQLELHSCTGLYQVGSLEIVEMNHQTRVEVAEAGGLIRLALDQSGQRQLALAHLNAVAQLRLQQQRQARCHPGLTRSGAVTDRLEALAAVDVDLAVVGIDAVHGLEAGRLEGITEADHGHHVDLVAQRHAGLFQSLAQLLAEGAALFEHQVAAEQLAGLAGQATVETVEEEADHGRGSYRQRQGDEQRTHVAGAQIAQQAAGGEAQQIGTLGPGRDSAHALTSSRTSSISRPSSRRRLRSQRAASAWSWVTSTRVVPASRLSWNSRSMMRAPVA